MSVDRDDNDSQSGNGSPFFTETNDGRKPRKLSKDVVVTRAEKQMRLARSTLANQYNNTRLCWAFYAGKGPNDNIYTDKIQFMDRTGGRRGATVYFNDIQKNIDAVNGFMSQNRRVAKYWARVQKDKGQQLYSRNMNGIKEFHRSRQHANQIESLGMLDVLVQGYGAIETDLTYEIGASTVMPNGEIFKKRLDGECVYWDSSARDINLKDARWCGYYEDYNLYDAMNLFKDSDEDDFEPVESQESNMAQSGYQFNPYGGTYDKIRQSSGVEWVSEDQQIIRVYRHQWFEYETFYKCENPVYAATSIAEAQFASAKLNMIAAELKQIGDTKTDDLFTLDPSAEQLVFDDRAYDKIKKAFGNSVQIVSFVRRAYYTAVFSGHHLFTWYRNISQNGFTIKFLTGTWNKTEKLWIGMANPMMEPQKYKNKALTELMFIIAVNSKGGVMVEKGAVEELSKFSDNWAKTDAVIQVADGALSGGRIQEKAKPALPTGLDTIVTLSDAAITANGVDPAFLGANDNDQSGLLFRRRIKQVISKFAKYDDTLSVYQIEEARLEADLIRIWVQNNKGELVRVVGQDGANEFIQLSEDLLAPSYDITIEEAPQAPEEKQETGMMLANTAAQLFTVGQVDSGKAFLRESLNLTRLDADIRDRLNEVLQPQQGVDPQTFMMLQQRLQQLEQVIQSGQLEKTKSETEKNFAQAAKTMADAQLSGASVPKVQAETIRTLEEAKRTAEEVRVVPDAKAVNVNV